MTEPGEPADRTTTAEPYLYAHREYPPPPEAGTTVSSVSRTSPVKESGPDD